MNKATFEEVKSFVEGKEGNNCKLLTTKEEFEKIYKGNTTKLLFLCPCGNSFEKAYDKFKNAKQRQCRECGRKNTALKKKKSTIVNCSCCGKEIEVTPYRLKNYKNIFCSKGCRSKYLSEHQKGENNPNFNSITVKCEYCNKEISKPRSLIRGRNFCSTTCANQYSSENYRGEKHHNYNHNLTSEERELGRNIDGYSEFIKGVFKRDGYKCQRCGSNKNLNAHHLNSYHWYKEGRTDVNNGVTLCGDCHKLFHEIYTRYNNTKEQYEEWISK